MLLWFYRLPLWFVITGIVTVIIVYSKLTSYLKRKYFKNCIKRFLTYVSLFLSFVLIYYAVLYNRPTDIHEAILLPFQSFIDAQTQPEMYRTMLMNVTLFVPFGISTSLLLPEYSKVSSRILCTVTFAACFAVLLESVQYVFSIGLTQTDDILCNTLGALLGSLVLVLEKHYTKNYCDNLDFY